MDTKAATDIQKKQKNNNTSETVKTNKEDSITDKDKVKTKSDNKQSKNRRIENISKSETDEDNLDDLNSEDLEDFDTDKEDTDNDLNDDEIECGIVNIEMNNEWFIIDIDMNDNI